jgi:hypothetical protein
MTRTASCRLAWRSLPFHATAGAAGYGHEPGRLDTQHGKRSDESVSASLSHAENQEGPEILTESREGLRTAIIHDVVIRA